MPIYTFLNGDAAQQDHWRLGPSLMHNLGVEAIGVAVTIDFTSSGLATDDLAETFWTYGSSDSETKVRPDYPLFGGGDGKLESLEAEAGRWGVHYDGLLHANETPVHELGHSIFAGLSHDVRLQIVALFGGDSDDFAYLFPADQPWENRIGEGIAETFKEAFLPARYRVFPNRTNRRISYRDFPKFRRLIRNIVGEGTDTYCYLYGSSVNRRPDVEARIGGKLPVHESARDPEAFVEYEDLKGFEHGYGVHLHQFAEAGRLPFTIEPAEGVIS